MAAVGLVVGGCAAPFARGQIIWPHTEGDWAGVTTNDVVPGDPVTLGNIVVCVDGADEGEIVRVRTPQPSGLTVSAFTVRPQSEWELFGGDRVPLAGAGAPLGVTTVRTPCGERLGTELIIEVRSDGLEIAEARELYVDYQVAGREGSTTVDFGVMICAPSAEQCEW